MRVASGALGEGAARRDTKRRRSDRYGHNELVLWCLEACGARQGTFVDVIIITIIITIIIIIVIIIIT